MTRAQQTISFGLLVSSVRHAGLAPRRSLPIRLWNRCTDYSSTSFSQLYLALFLELIPLPPKIQEQVVPVVRCNNPPPLVMVHTSNIDKLPFWALVSFGALLLFRLGFGILTFNDVPKAHQELMAEIDEAKKDLRTLGVSVD